MLASAVAIAAWPIALASVMEIGFSPSAASVLPTDCSIGVVVVSTDSVPIVDVVVSICVVGVVVISVDVVVSICVVGVVSAVDVVAISVVVSICCVGVVSGVGVVVSVGGVGGVKSEALFS